MSHDCRWGNAGDIQITVNLKFRGGVGVTYDRGMLNLMDFTQTASNVEGGGSGLKLDYTIAVVQLQPNPSAANNGTSYT